MPHENRYFRDGVFISEALPEIAVRLPAEFDYLGQTAFILEEIAQVDRRHFLAADSEGAVSRLVILHFESILPTVEGQMSFRIPDPPDHAGPNYRYTLAPVRLGEHEYIHNTWFFDAQANIRDNPHKELAQTAQLLSRRGYALPDELRMSRYVRAVDAERRSELILFYMEPLAATGFSLDDFVVGGEGAAVFDRLSAELTVRSGQVFQIEQG